MFSYRDLNKTGPRSGTIITAFSLWVNVHSNARTAVSPRALEREATPDGGCDLRLMTDHTGVCEKDDHRDI